LAERVLEFVRTMEGDEDYPSNLRAMARQEHLTSHHIGLMASAVSGWHRKQQKLVKEEVERATPALNEWIGARKDKLAGIPVTVVSLKPMLEGNYPSTLVTMRDDQGRTLKWFASNPPEIDEGGKAMIDAATIKDLDEYRGTKQTVITRAKLTVAE